MSDDFWTLQEIEERRVRSNIPKDALNRAAGLSAGYYHKLLARKNQPGAAVLARLKQALKQNEKRRLREFDDLAMKVAFRYAIALAGNALRVEPSMVHRQDPARRATQSSEWMKAAEVRRVAIYLMNVGSGFAQARVARAAGMTKQAISLACREIEERRTDPGFDRMLEKLTADTEGEW